MQVRVFHVRSSIYSMFVLFNHQAIWKHIRRESFLGLGNPAVFFLSKIPPPSLLKVALILSALLLLLVPFLQACAQKYIMQTNSWWAPPFTLNSATHWRLWRYWWRRSYWLTNVVIKSKIKSFDDNDSCDIGNHDSNSDDNICTVCEHWVSMLLLSLLTNRVSVKQE